MSGRKIEDHGGWPSTSDALMKSTNKVKHYTSAEGSGHMADYPDTTEAVHRDQEHAKSKIHSDPMKPGFRY
jgi:hypothetical protein